MSHRPPFEPRLDVEPQVSGQRLHDAWRLALFQMSNAGDPDRVILSLRVDLYDPPMIGPRVVPPKRAQCRVLYLVVARFGLFHEALPRVRSAQLQDADL